MIISSLYLRASLVMDINIHQACFQVLDRNCFSDENGTLSDTFLDRTGDEEAKVTVAVE